MSLLFVVVVVQQADRPGSDALSIPCGRLLLIMNHSGIQSNSAILHPAPSPGSATRLLLSAGALLLLQHPDLIFKTLVCFPLIRFRRAADAAQRYALVSKHLEMLGGNLGGERPSRIESDGSHHAVGSSQTI